MSFVVKAARPDETTVRLWRVDPYGGCVRLDEITAGEIEFDSRYSVVRTHRDDDREAIEIAQDIAEDVYGVGQA